MAGLNAVNFKTDTRLSRVNLTWGKAMTTPTAYEIFYSTSKNGKYTKLGETKNTFYNTKKLTVGKTYYFRIRAYKYSGPSSNPKKYKCLGTFQTKSVYPLYTTSGYGDTTYRAKPPIAESI
ncbi:Fibronectin type III domain protein, partial [human gut metagenome]